MSENREGGVTLSMALSQLACVPPRGQVMDGLPAEGCGLDSKAQPRLLALLLARTRSAMEPSQPRQAHGVGWGSGRHLPRIPLPGDWGPVLCWGQADICLGDMLPSLGRHMTPCLLPSAFRPALSHLSRSP